MDIDAERKSLLRQYLLGILSEDELSRVEMQILSDKEFYDQVQAAEEELIDEYLNGELIRQDLIKFEQVFLATPEGNEQVELARMLRQYAADRTQPQAIKRAVDADKQLSVSAILLFLRAQFRQARLAFLFLLLIMMVAVVWLTIRVLRLQDEMGQLRASQTPSQSTIVEMEKEIVSLKTNIAQLAAELQQAQESKAVLEKEIAAMRINNGNRNLGPDSEQTALVAMTLKPGGARSNGLSNTIEITSHTKSVLLRLILSDNSYIRYNVVVESAEGRTIRTEQALAARSASGKHLRLTIPSEVLSAGDYLIKIFGLTNEGQAEGSDIFYFRILRK